MAIQPKRRVINIDDGFEETLLYIHQEQGKKDLMCRYANSIDATYKTTKYTAKTVWLFQPMRSLPQLHFITAQLRC